ncbi:hypothetical protein NXW71_01295 [Parabacteroides merdae]|nr:hypothetical protein [Parabacteroides merdae]
MMIPFKVKTFSFLLACACSTAGMAQVGNDSPVKQVKISGYVGTRITDCIEHRVKAQDVDHLVEPFRHQEREVALAKRVLGEMDTGCDRLLSL